MDTPESPRTKEQEQRGRRPRSREEWEAILLERRQRGLPAEMYTRREAPESRADRVEALLLAMTGLRYPCRLMLTDDLPLPGRAKHYEAVIDQLLARQGCDPAVREAVRALGRLARGSRKALFTVEPREPSQ